MAREVTPDQFTDDELSEFINSVERLVWSSSRKLPKTIADRAEAFAQSNPRPTLDEIRQHIEHAVSVARGWDDPEDPRTMLHSALKSYYLVTWIERLFDAKQKPKDASHYATKVAFTPMFRNPGPG